MQLPKLLGGLTWTPNLGSAALTARPVPLTWMSLSMHSSGLQSKAMTCLLLCGASIWQSAGDRAVSNISRCLMNTEQGSSSFWAHKCIWPPCCGLLWSLSLGKTEQQLKQKGPLLKGHQECYSVLSEVWFPHCKDAVMFSACLETLEILHRHYSGY